MDYFRVFFFLMLLTSPLLAIFILLFSILGIIYWLMAITISLVILHYVGGSCLLILQGIVPEKQLTHGFFYHKLHNICYQLEIKPPLIYLSTNSQLYGYLVQSKGEKFFFINQDLMPYLDKEEQEIILFIQLIKIKRGVLTPMQLGDFGYLFLTYLTNLFQRWAKHSLNRSPFQWWLAVVGGSCCTFFSFLYLNLVGPDRRNREFLAEVKEYLNNPDSLDRLLQKFSFKRDNDEYSYSPLLF